MEDLAAFTDLSDLEVVHREVVQHVEDLPDLSILYLEIVLLPQEWRTTLELFRMFFYCFQHFVTCFEPCLVAVWTVKGDINGACRPLLCRFPTLFCKIFDKANFLKEVIDKLTECIG